MPRQPPSLVSDRLLSLVASGAGRGSGDEVVERLERGWVPVEPGSVQLSGPVGDEGDVDSAEVGGPQVHAAEVAAAEGAAAEGEAAEGDGARDPVGAHPGRPGGRERESRLPGRESGLPGRHRDPRGRQGPAMVTLPVSLRGARVGVSWVGIVALVLVLGVAALVFAVRVARAESGVVPEPVAGSTPLGVVRSTTPEAFVISGGSAGSTVAVSTGGSSGAVSGGKAGTGGGASGTTVSSTIVVHVVGQVARPGVVTLPAGSRIGDAVTRAGGPLPGADVARLNLAQFLADGEQVYVPRPGEDPPAPIGGSGGSAGGAGGPGSAAGGSPTVVVVDLNAADLAGLDTLPGVGPVLAQRIVDWRAQHGRFSAVDELGEVSGIGDRLLEQLRPLVRV
ncbi:ComEA family DNA-binding protein [Lapillicoccus sp.]|uniref:ComEA family DNA-binding protein n=1 Tax=Lapillicoccus sp. TaxID=1909287 RepID=UPI0025D00688|nr:ComEA family DNA-binding protein [Lapillicoccus sp.]